MPTLLQDCNNCCGCDFFFQDLWDASPGSGSTSHDVTGEFIAGHDVRIVANPDVTVTSYRVHGTIGAASFDSGFLAYPTVYDTTISVPAGATSIAYNYSLSATGSNQLTVEFSCPA